MPGRYLIANWKMNLPPEGVEAYLGAIGNTPRGTATVIVAPPFPYLREVGRLATGETHVSAQNCADHESGAFTGEVSVSMIRDCGARYVILGHSERRQMYGETDALIARKLAVVIASGLTPVLCIGEDLKTRDSGRVAMVLADQIRAVAGPELEKAAEVVIAYEPVWAIGSGRYATGLMIAETLVHIREALNRFWPARLASTPLLYGGSATPENVGEIVANGRTDGFLVGGAALDSRKFLAIEALLNAT